MKTNENHWTISLFYEQYGKGAGLELIGHGYNDKEMNHVGYSLRSVQKHNKYTMESKYRTTLAHNSGICWLCGETDPRVLEGHHLYESRSENKHGNTFREDFICGICANCHRKRKTTGGKTEEHQIAILKAIEKEWFGLGGD